jgi:hypothetical protein
MAKPWLCRIGRHRWQRLRNPEGGWYRECTGADDNGPALADPAAASERAHHDHALALPAPTPHGVQLVLRQQSVGTPPMRRQAQQYVASARQ